MQINLHHSLSMASAERINSPLDIESYIINILHNCDSTMSQSLNIIWYSCKFLTMAIISIVTTWLLAVLLAVASLNKERFLSSFSSTNVHPTAHCDANIKVILSSWDVGHICMWMQTISCPLYLTRPALEWTKRFFEHKRLNRKWTRQSHTHWPQPQPLKGTFRFGRTPHPKWG